MCYLAAMSSQMQIHPTPVDMRFPVGRFARPEQVSLDERIYAIAELAELPSQLRNAVDDLDDEQLDTPYRDGGWTVRRLVHHIADSHMMAVTRVRLALTSDWPTIMPYDEKAWAMLHDYAGAGGVVAGTDREPARALGNASAVAAR